MRLLPAVAAAALLLAVSGCTQVVPLEPAVDAEDARCADVVVHLPDTVGGRDSDLGLRETNAQGTAAWGTPSAAILRCGVPVPDPTSTLRCYTADGIDWLLDETDAPNLVYTSYGREPAVEVIVNQDDAAGGAVLLDLASAVGYTDKVGACTTVDDEI